MNRHVPGAGGGGRTALGGAMPGFAHSTGGAPVDEEGGAMTRIYRNRRRRAGLKEEPSRAPLEFHRRLPGYEPSRLVDAPGLASACGVARVWVKDESNRLGLPSFKILGASWGVYKTLERHLGGFAEWTSPDELKDQLAGRGPLALAAATDGNHGRAVARMARLLGLGARIFVPAGTAAARIAGIESEGASCEVVPGTYEEAVARSAQEAGESCLLISDTSWPGYEDVPRWVIEGYSTIFWEIEDELERRAEPRPDVVVVQLGVGALGASAARHYRRPGVTPSPVLVGVEPERAACLLASMEAGAPVTVEGPHDSIMAGLNCGRPSLVAWPLVSRYFDVFVAIDDDPARDAMRALASSGIVAGETGAAGLAGLMELLGSGEPATVTGIGHDSAVLLLSTEGATDPAAYERTVGAQAGRPQ